jgi:hypothetical protein
VLDLAPVPLAVVLVQARDLVQEQGRGQAQVAQGGREQETWLAMDVLLQGSSITS